MNVYFTLKSEYSISKSTITIKEGVKLAVKNGYNAVLLADDFNLFGVLDFANECVKNKILPIIGVVVHFEFEGKMQELTLIAKTQIGFQNLLLITTNSVLKSEKPWVSSFKDILEHSQDLIFIITKPEENLINTLKEKDVYIGISRLSNEEAEVKEEGALLNFALKFNIPIICYNNAYFQTPEMYEANDVLRCVGEGRFLLEDGRDQISLNNFFKPCAEFESLFKDLPEAIENLHNLVYKISFIPQNSKPLLPSFASDEETEMRSLAFQGLEERILKEEIILEKFGKEEYIKRLEYEIKVISGMGFCGYFLIVADFINWSKKNDIPVGPGRGSGAGSLVAFCLKITDLDPLYYGLLFERFLNPERVSMPDFDIDFCQERRGEVTNYVKQKYGEDSVAGIITFGRLQARAVLKDVGRVMQIPYIVVDKICKMIPFNPVEPITLEKAIELDPELAQKRNDDETIAKLLDIGLKLEGLIRHASAHAAGIIIADRPLVKIVPLFKAEKDDDLPVVGYHMKAAENAGLVKFDFLGLKTLTIIANTCKLIFINTAIKVDINKINFKDEKTFELLKNGLTLGIFQLESLVCKDSMKKMKIDKMEDIIALTSLNRPGPMENIPSYINRKIGKEKITYPHESLKELLEETYGIIIYQEQVIKIAQVLAGYSLGEADLLRRAMGKKIKEEMEAQRKRFTEGALQNNISEKLSLEIFALVEKFAGYGFNKSHAAAYSVISFQTAFLKAHFPVQFFVANLNMAISDTDDINLFINDAKHMGIKINFPCINNSQGLFATEGKEIYYGLGALKSVGIVAMNEMVDIRNSGGKFKDIFDFCKRVGARISNKKQLEALTKSGAFDCFNINKKQILESIEILINYAHNANTPTEASLFGECEISIPKLKYVSEDFTSSEVLQNEFDAIGFYLSFHPLENFREALHLAGFISYNNLENELGEKEKRFKMAGVVNIVKQRSGARGRFAFVYLSDLSGIFEASIFKDELITKNRDNLIAGKLIGITVSVSKQENGSIRIIINDIFNLNEFIEKAKPTKEFEKEEEFLEEKELKIHLASIHQLPLVKAFLNEYKNNAGVTKIKLRFEENEIRLENNFKIPSYKAKELIMNLKSNI